VIKNDKAGPKMGLRTRRMEKSAKMDGIGL